MKRLSVILVALLLTVGFYAVASAGISGSKHDFSSASWNISGEICRVCHVPHDSGRASNTSGLLWSHDLSTATYTMYSGATSSSLQGAVSSEPDGISKLCLACHDGTVAVDAFGGQSGTFKMGDYYSTAVVPGVKDDKGNLDLRGTHPISIVYDNTADTGLKDPDTTDIGTSGKIQDVLDHGKVQCSSCHDVHNQEAVPGSRLLRVASSGSQLCLSCHIK